MIILNDGRNIEKENLRWDEVMVEKINLVLQRYIAVLTIVSLVAGILFHEMGEHFIVTVPYIFAVMTFIGSLRMKFSDLKIFYKAPKTIILSLILLHIVMPFVSYAIAQLIFDDHLLVIGFVILMSIPTGVTSVIWINLTKGNMALGLSIILLDVLLAPIILPTILKIVSGTAVELNVAKMVFDLIWMIVLPTVLGIVVNEVSHGRFPDRYSMKLAPISKICLFLIVFINSSAVAPYVKTLNAQLFLVILTVFIVVIIGYAVVIMISTVVHLKHDVKVTLTFIGGMRNISTGIIIATTYFPNKVAMPVVLGMLFQQAFASMVSSYLNRKDEKILGNEFHS